jgi:hypothetical protein
MRRDRRAILAATVIRWRRMVPVRARAWNRLARQPAARVRLWAMAASASQAAFAAKDPEVIWSPSAIVFDVYDEA